MLATFKGSVTGTAGSEEITSKVSISNMKLEQVTAPRAALDPGRWRPYDPAS
ncbi:MAG: hypothetical protein H6Q89_4461 [Myxococcaceae bacterium]|nr:hypothetical protein [Myxococcaceae bacterium]